MHRVRHNCQYVNCKNKSKEKILQIHHIVTYRKIGATAHPTSLRFAQNATRQKIIKAKGFCLDDDPKPSRLHQKPS